MHLHIHVALSIATDNPGSGILSPLLESPLKVHQTILKLKEKQVTKPFSDKDKLKYSVRISQNLPIKNFDWDTCIQKTNALSTLE